MGKWLLSPPAAFMVILLACWLFSRAARIFSFRSKNRAPHAGDPYACGEDNYDNMAHPDYTVFFPFIFFFTIAHVATLMITTAHTQTPHVFLLAALYLAGGAAGLYILLRR